MKRQTILTFAAAALLAIFPAMDFNPPTANAQDVTITIKKGGDETTKPAFTGERAAVDVAILLDTSNSMDGLISQAKSQLWKIVQQFADTEKAGKTPSLRVAVFEYGNSGLPASEGYVRQVVQLTDDLDKVSEALFALKTSGGDEYCGTVINEALKRLDWSNESSSYKAIFIAGNEPFTQGSVDYKDACKKAIESGVVVNTIHCGDYSAGVKGGWEQGAKLAEGEFLNINQDKKVVHIKCPQDEIIIKLNSDLNKTYLWYGTAHTRAACEMNQVAQDNNALRVGGGAGFGGGRGVTKASSLYQNFGRDLVDTQAKDEAILSKLDSKLLPEKMQKMSAEERKAHLKKMADSRAEIKKKILEVAKEREAYLAKVRAEKANSGAEADTFGDVISAAIVKQLKKSGFESTKR
ncbi:MAG: VWA domain-containing protein [Mariniblastus sp.]